MFHRHIGRHWHPQHDERDERVGHHERDERHTHGHQEHSRGRGWRERMHDHLRPHGGRHQRGPFGFAPKDRDGFGFPFGRGGPFGGDPFGEDGGGRRRQRRGDIKLILLELLAEQPRHGYELIKDLEQRSAGFYRPSPGSVYPTLQLLEDEGHLTSETVAGKRVYTITDAGRQLLASSQPRAGDERAHGREHGFRRGAAAPELHELQHSMMTLGGVVMQAARHSSAAQLAAIIALLNATRREVYAILAKDDAGE